MKPPIGILGLPVLACVLGLVLAACAPEPAATPAENTITVEVKLNDRPIPMVSDARVIVLPTGERILVLTGDDGMAACCLLPPKPEVKVEK